MGDEVVHVKSAASKINHALNLIHTQRIGLGKRKMEKVTREKNKERAKANKSNGTEKLREV